MKTRIVLKGVNAECRVDSGGDSKSDLGKWTNGHRYGGIVEKQIVVHKDRKCNANWKTLERITFCV